MENQAIPAAARKYVSCKKWVKTITIYIYVQLIYQLIYENFAWRCAELKRKKLDSGELKSLNFNGNIYIFPKECLDEVCRKLSLDPKAIKQY